MATRSPQTRPLLPDDAAALLWTVSAPDARADLVCSAVVELLDDVACVIYRPAHQSDGVAWRAAATVGAVTLAESEFSSETRLLAPLLADPGSHIVYPGDSLLREDLAHLHVPRSIQSLAYLPLLAEGSVVAAVEVISLATLFSAEDMLQLEPLLQVAGLALLRADEAEQEKEALLSSVHRLTQLYDLEKSLNSTLDLDQVIGLIPRKIVEMLHCQAVHLWLFDGEVLTLKSTSGTDSTVYVGSTQGAGDGYVGDAAEEGEPLLIADADDPRLLLRNRETQSLIRTAMVVPIMQDDAEVGVIEAVNKSRDDEPHPFDEDDEFFLISISETVSSALKNASLMFAERKLAILEALVHVSSEITSTLRLERLLQIIVNSPQGVLPFERSAIALDNRGKLQLKAISGMPNLPIGEVRVELLQELLRWLSGEEAPLHLKQTGDSPGPELPPPVARYFEATGYRGLFALPLTDEQGRVGMVLYESGEPDFLELSHTEMIKILAGQATVAVRNALLYREVPLITLLEPLMQRKQALLRTSRGRVAGFAVGAALAAIFLVFCPLPMRLSGLATVGPHRLVTVAAPVDGIVGAVSAHEGQRVQKGQSLASMNDLQWRMELNSAETRYRTAELTMESDLAKSSPEAGADRAQVEYLQAEAKLARNRIENAELRSPIDGIVVTPALENAAGEHLDAGAQFAQVLDLSAAVVDVAIPQSEASLLVPGERVAIKLDAYPQRSWHATVAFVSPQAQAGDGVRTFTARVVLPNEDAALRAGMTGRAKIFVGYHPAGFVLLRGPALWGWQTLWNWFGW